MRDQMIKALLAHAQGDIEKHKANVEIYLNNPVVLVSIQMLWKQLKKS